MAFLLLFDLPIFFLSVRKRILLFIRLYPTKLLATRNSARVVDLYLQKTQNSANYLKTETKYTPKRQVAKDGSFPLLLSILSINLNPNHSYVLAASLELDTFSLVVLSHPYIVIFELPDYSF